MHTLEFSNAKVVRSAHSGGVTALDLDPTEQRYLLAGAADASVAIYDTQQVSCVACGAAVGSYVCYVPCASVKQYILLPPPEMALCTTTCPLQPSTAEALGAAQAAQTSAAAAAALTGARAPRASVQAAVAAANAEHSEHAALLSIGKQAPGAHKYSVSAVAWYPVDSGLFVSGGWPSPPFTIYHLDKRRRY